MRSGIFDYFNFHRLKAKRRLTAFMNMRGPAAALEDGASLVAAIDDAIRRDEHLFEQEMLWRARRDPRTEHGGEARDMDRRLDGLLGGVHAALSAQVRLSPVDAERGAAASSMLEELFPEGLGGLTQRSYHEQAHATRLLLRRYRQSANQQALAAALGLDKALEELAALNAEFTAALNA